MSGHSTHGGVGHETQDINFNLMMWLIPICMILLVVYVITCWLGATTSLTREMARKQTMGAEAGSATLKAFRAQEDSTMHEYGWKDKDKGTVQIPIDRAMEMTVKEANRSVDTPAKAEAR